MAACSRIAILLSEARVFLTFWPLSRKLKEKPLCVLCGSSEAGGEFIIKGLPHSLR
jgi:hypothetical protein